MKKIILTVLLLIVNSSAAMFSKPCKVAFTVDSVISQYTDTASYRLSYTFIAKIQISGKRLLQTSDIGYVSWDMSAPCYTANPTEFSLASPDESTTVIKIRARATIKVNDSSGLPEWKLMGQFQLKIVTFTTEEKDTSYWYHGVKVDTTLRYTTEEINLLSLGLNTGDTLSKEDTLDLSPPPPVSIERPPTRMVRRHFNGTKILDVNGRVVATTTARLSQGRYFIWDGTKMRCKIVLK